ncbi:cell-cycle checkpoint serine-threonine kinase [Lineolata rhizophorae]|uniref:Cell-cycle checkpoint serine-threonine kinase n=1 Tax=Lineolata rhizophorae TaxID=578093 RepID=A0A6A6NYA9_9PEZI|nr:cell-cycle checkpoint serine-threonine kinase [Lineolata rhizophorae]
MPRRQEKSQLKRGQLSSGDTEIEPKKPRRSQRLSAQLHADPKFAQNPLPSPITHKDTSATEEIEDDGNDDSTVTRKDGTATPPEPHSQRPAAGAAQPSQGFSPRAPGLSSPPADTQPFSQFVYPPRGLLYEVEDEDGEGVWGYLVPLDANAGEPLVLKKRAACPLPDSKPVDTDGRKRVNKRYYEKQEEEYEKRKAKGVSAGGYLIGRHPECDRIINRPTISNRHCLLFSEKKDGESNAIVEDLSANGTFVNEALIGRNKRRELNDGDEISIVGEARYMFYYSRSRSSNAFRQQYSIGEQLGKGHFATVHLCVEKSSGMRYAVKKFEKRHGPSERSRFDGLQQEIGVLMSVSHPALLCLKDTFDEDDGVYLVLELAPEGELFNWIVMKQKLTEVETRRVFVQLFQAVKYLHERNIVHRDIKPENILLADKNLTVKLADFGLAKIIGEESFTTTLCGTPSYVAPEILENTSHRRYTRAVDVWSLGVVLYICLCGFPPFSDELYSSENPYTLSQQIKMGRFDYPSPYWDSVGDPALDLIDRMLTVNVDERISIDGCLEHPWTTQRELSLKDSTEGLTSAIGKLDFAKRKPVRERTLLASINDVRVSKVITVPRDDAKLKIYEKNPGVECQNGHTSKDPPRKSQQKIDKEATPAAERDPNEFMAMGGKGDQTLYGDDTKSRYAPNEDVTEVKAAAAARD